MSLCKRYVSSNLPKTNSYNESVQKNTSQPIYRKQTGTKFKVIVSKENQVKPIKGRMLGAIQQNAQTFNSNHQNKHDFMCNKVHFLL